MNDEKANSLLSCLGLARRAGVLIIGQDNVKSSLARRDSLLVLITETGSSFYRFLQNRPDGESRMEVLRSVSAEALSSAIGAEKVKVVALPLRSGLAQKTLQLLAEGGKEFE